MGDYLRYRREKADLSLMQVTRRLGLKSTSSLCNWESNFGPVPMNHLKKLARFYSCPNIEIRRMIVKFEIIKLKEKWGLYE